MSIFNSLGSNYSLAYTILALKQLAWPDRGNKFRLKQLLEESFKGEAVLLYNGRDAIEYCLEAYGIVDGDTVLTQAWSCSSLEEAIERTGAQAAYFDLKRDQVVVTLKQIKQAYDRFDQAKAVILQHTLGYIDEIEEISQFCKQKGLLLIMDLAQAVGGKSSSGLEAHEYGDALILSFGRDKILDAISGGAVIFKTKPKHKPLVPNWFDPSHDLSNKKQVTKLLFYPLITQMIRVTYDLGLGKVLHSAVKRLNLIWTPIKSPHQEYQSMPAYFAPLVIKRMNELTDQLTHRRKIASFYLLKLQNLNSLKCLVDQNQIDQGTNLRFPVQIEQEKVDQLLFHLAEEKIYLEDRWYRRPVDSGQINFKTSYKNRSCPWAEQLSRTVINLPTHRQISLDKAEKITQLLNNFLK